MHRLSYFPPAFPPCSMMAPLVICIDSYLLILLLKVKSYLKKNKVPMKQERSLVSFNVKQYNLLGKLSPLNYNY